MPCFLCGKKADQHVAVASRASSSAPSSAHHNKRQKQKHSKTTATATRHQQEHGQEELDEDFAALQKWRETHSPKSQHSTTAGAATSPPKNHTNAMEEEEAKQPKAAAKGKKKKKFMFGGSKNSKKDKSKSSSPSSSGSGSSSSYNLGMGATKQPVKMSPRAIQAWQQKQPGQSPPSAPPPPPPPPAAQQYQRQSNTPPRDLRSPYEISSVTSRSSSSRSGEKRKPPRTQHAYGKQQQQQQQPLDSMAVPGSVIPADASSLSPPQQQSHTTPSSHLMDPPRAPVPRTNSWRKRHDHESLKDQLIRDVVLRQNSSSGNSSSNNSYNNNNNNSTGSVGSGERIRGQVFLQVNPMDAISPRSSIDETDDSEYMEDDMASVSDIFSDHHLSTAFTNTSIDSSSRERYILACRLLRARMMQKNPPPIMPMERDLLQDLLERFETSEDAGSRVAFETLAKILEDSDNQRKNNDDIMADKNNRSTPATYARSRSNGSANSRHSAGNLLDMSREGDLTVASIREEETGFSTSLKHHNSQSHAEDQQQYLPPTYARVQSWKDEKNTKAMPHLVEEDDKMSSTSLSSMIRLDGWNLTSREQYPFEIMGLDKDTPPATRVLTPALMEALRGFFPYSVSEANFWLKFSLVRDGASLRQLLHKCMASQHTVICVETNDGDVFGSFCSTGWKNNGNQKWFGSGEAFLWRLKQSRYVRGASSADRQHVRGNEMEVYPYCPGNDDMVQYCTPTTLAVGGGSWNNTVCPYPGEPTGIGLLLDGDLEGGETNSCATFANPRLCGRATTSNEFTIRNVEVWTLTPCDSIPMAEQLERQKYFLNEHSERGTSPR